MVSGPMSTVSGVSWMVEEFRWAYDGGWLSVRCSCPAVVMDGWMLERSRVMNNSESRSGERGYLI